MFHTLMAYQIAQRIEELNQEIQALPRWRLLKADKILDQMRYLDVQLANYVFGARMYDGKD